MNHPPPLPFQQPAILGATISGGEIAALFANAGLRTKIYDRPATAGRPEQTVEALIEGLQQQTPSPFTGLEAASLLEARNYRDHWKELGEHDLIIECYESLEHKQGWLTRLSPAFAKDAVILSITLSDSPADIAKALGAGMRPRFVGGHFFTQPRFHRLVEIIPTRRSEDRNVERLSHFLQTNIGMLPVVVADKPNFIANRMLYFALSCALSHGKRLDIPLAVLEPLTGLVMGKMREQGICYQLDALGISRYLNIATHIGDEDQAHFGDLLALPRDILNRCDSEHHNFYRVIKEGHEPEFFTQKHYVIDELVSLFESRDWHKLTQHASKEAQFLCQYLRDLWQYLMYVSKDSGFSGDMLDHFLLHAFQWTQGPYQLLQDFSPATVYETTKQAEKNGEIDYPVLSLWRRRTRSSSKAEVHVGDAFTEKCELIGESDIARLYRYRGKLTLWQPINTNLSIDKAVLADLTAACTVARREQTAIMIYHHGKHFGGGITHTSQISPSAITEEHTHLIEAILALRMHPHPVLLSVSGQITDNGCALMMQADRVICTADLSWRLRAIDYGLPPVGGIWFEWLRRLPRLSPELTRLQIHTVLDLTLKTAGIHSVHAAHEVGILRTHDCFVMNPEQQPDISQCMADAWLDSRSNRPQRYPLYKLTAEDHRWLNKRSHSTLRPELYRSCVALLAAIEQKNVLSLRRLLTAEAELYQQYLGNQPV